jgi:predicted TIM-barrel fold metal-dependent hydrolase
MAGARVGDGERLTQITDSASVPNICIKMSGFHYVAPVTWEYPYHDTHDVVRGLYHAFGADRLFWGSDYPVVRRHMTHQHALEAFRTHCTFIPEADRQKILGPSLQYLLKAAT